MLKLLLASLFVFSTAFARADGHSLSIQQSPERGAYTSSIPQESSWFLENIPSDRKPGMVSLCSGITTIVIKGPQEQDDCDGFFDVLFYADLRTRNIYWSRQALQSLASIDHKEAVTGVLRHQLQTYGKETLETMRRFELFEMDESKPRKD